MITVTEFCDEVSDTWDGQTQPKRVSLQTLMNRHGTDKLYLHHYDGEYERHFDRLRDKGLILLEIGVGGYGNRKLGGESLKVWRDYFTHASIHGMDSEPKDLNFGGRVMIWQGDQSRAEDLVKIVSTIGAPDIVIDDGSHRPNDIFTSFTTLFPLMASGGIYVIEDLETSYRPDFGGNADAPPTIGLIQRLIDGLHWQFWKGRGPKPIDQMVKSVHVSKELVFLYKQ